MKQINYLEILKKGWRLSWDHKYLWWFGLFMALGNGANFNYNNFGNNNPNQNFNFKENEASAFIVQHWFLLAAAIVILAALAIVIIILRIRARAGLIKSLQRIEKNEETSFRWGFREGKKYFWKLLGTGLILCLFIFGIIFILVIPVAFLFMLNSIALGILAALAALIILVPLIVLFAYLAEYTSLYLVLADLDIRPAIECAYELFRNNIWESIILSLLFIPIRLASALIIFSLAGILAVPALISYFIHQNILAIIFGVIGALIFVTSVLFLESVLQTFTQSTWFVFFNEIAREQKKEIVVEKEAEKEISENIIPEPKEV